MDAILAPWPSDCLPFGSSIDMWRRALAPRFRMPGFRVPCSFATLCLLSCPAWRGRGTTERCDKGDKLARLSAPLRCQGRGSGLL